MATYNKLWLSEVDGHLYRDNNFDKPVRRNMAYWTDRIRTVADLKAVIRASDKAFGGYSLVLWMYDSECLCHKCARSEFYNLAYAVSTKSNNGWRPVAACTNEQVEDYAFCANCNQTI